VAGWLSFHPFIGRSAYRSTAEISLYVHENFRRRGFGDQLLKKAIAECSHLKISALVGCIFGHNGPSLRLFERMGFERWGFLPRIARLDRVERDLVILGRHV
jgi:L-amino acid N-acyltransferase YncA